MKFLGKTDGKPLVSKLFEAWKYGPVLPDLYHRLKIFGDKPINDFFLVSRNMDLDEHKVIEEVVNLFTDFSPGELVEVTHESGGAWDQYFILDGRGVVIPNEAILDEYIRSPF